MAQRKFNLFYIYKFNSDFLVKNAMGKDMEYTVNQARQDLNLVSLADNQVFQFLRKIKGVEFNRNKLDEIYKERNDEKSLPKLKQNVAKIEQCQKQIDDILFVPDIITVKMKNKQHYKDLIKNGFSINGIKFVRLVCTAAYLRRNTVGFINEKYFKQLNEILMCGLDGKLKETNLGKYSAYYGLFMSATNQVTTPNVCVINDYESDLKDQVVNYITTDEFGNEIIEERVMDLPMNWFDGQGLISPKMAEVWMEDLGLDYLPSGFIVRSAYIKGLCVPFDFHKFAKEVANTNKIKDVWGVEYNIDDIDVILTISQFKMWKMYENWQDYLFYFNKYGHSWGVSRVNKEYDDEFVLTNYQYLQTLNLNKDDIRDLAQPTIDWINSIGEGDLMNVLLYLMGGRSDNGEDEAEQIFSEVQMDFVKALTLNPELLKDEYVKSQILKTLKRKIKDAKIGRIWVRGNYSFQISDPYGLAQWAFEMPVTGLLRANEMYCNFWNERTDNEKILCSRSPLVHSSEHLIRDLVSTEEMNEWYKYVWSGIVNGIHDMAVVNMSDSDYDGDIIFSTDNQIMIDAVMPSPPVTYAKRKAPNQKLTQHNLVVNDLRGFGSQIGQITNVASSIIGKQANFEKDSPEWKELEKRVRLMRKIQGAEIDAAKGLARIPMPKHWTHKQRIDYENDTEEEIKRKEFENRIVVDRKPYFMSYIYPQLQEDYKKYVKKHNAKCQRYVGKNINQIFEEGNRTDEEKKLIYQYNRYMPVMKNNCVMNELCSLIEEADFNLKYFKKKEEFDWTILLNKEYEVKRRSALYARITDILQRYKDTQDNLAYSVNALMDISTSSKELDEYIKEMKNINQMFFLEKEIEHIGLPREEIYNYFVDLIYTKFKKGYHILWNVFPDQIFKAISLGKMIYPVRDEDGEYTYFGERYSFKVVDLDLSEEGNE